MSKGIKFMYCMPKYIERLKICHFLGFDGNFGGHFENNGHFEFFSFNF